MAGLSGVLNIGYHGTSPANLRSIATSGFTGGTGQSSKLLGMNMPSWGGTGKVYTAPNINVASTYGPRQIPVVQSAKHLKVPGGGIPGKTFTEALKNIGKTKFGFETALKPGQATKGMNLYNKLMSGAYANSPMAQRLLTTGTTAIKSPSMLGPLGWGATAGQGLGFLANEYAKATNSPEAYEFLKSMGGANFNFDETNLDVGDIFSTIQKINQKAKIKKQKQNFQNIEAKAAAEAKAKADAAAAAKAASSFNPSGPTQASIRRDRADKSGRGHIGGFTNPGKGSYGPHKADGGLINFYRYGGFI